jgi:hypothetical protein
LLEAGDPTTILTSPKTSAQTPSFNVSLGHFCLVEGGGVLALGGGLVLGVDDDGGGGLALGVDDGGGGLALGVFDGGGGGQGEGGGGLGLGVGGGLHEPQACENDE